MISLLVGNQPNHINIVLEEIHARCIEVETGIMEDVLAHRNNVPQIDLHLLQQLFGSCEDATLNQFATRRNTIRTTRQNDCCATLFQNELLRINLYYNFALACYNQTDGVGTSRKFSKTLCILLNGKIIDQDLIVQAVFDIHISLNIR